MTSRFGKGSWFSLFLGLAVTFLLIVAVASFFFIAAAVHRGQEREAAVLNLLNRVAVIAASCADQPGHQTSFEVDRCVVLVLGYDYRGKP